jgi:anti-sigma regulatory factor (Ser/Thr protein kinase)
MIAVLIRTMRPYFESPSRLLVRLEEALADSLRPGTFITMFYGILDPKTGELVFASAAHNPVLFYRAQDGVTQWHKTTGVPVGMARGGALASSLKDDTVRLAPGDVALVFTDGVNEAVNASFEEYGLDGLHETMLTMAPKGGSNIVEKLRSAVTHWEGGRPAEDDKTILVIERIARESAALGTGGGGDEENGRRLRRLWEMRDKSRRISLPAQLDALDAVHDWMQECEHLENLSRKDKILVEHGVYEILSNIAEHGCQLDGNKTIDIWWIVEESAGRMDGYFLIRDHGLPPHPEEWSWAEPETPPDLRKGRGYGLRIIRESLSEVEFHGDTGKGNLTLAHCPIPAQSGAVTEL